MSYFSYHARNKKLIKEGLLENYYYETRNNKIYLVLAFKDGRKFPIKEERWLEYDNLFSANYDKGDKNEKNN